MKISKLIEKLKEFCRELLYIHYLDSTMNSLFLSLFHVFSHLCNPVLIHQPVLFFNDLNIFE